MSNQTEFDSKDTTPLPEYKPDFTLVPKSKVQGTLLRFRGEPVGLVRSCEIIIDSESRDGLMYARIVVPIEIVPE